MERAGMERLGLARPGREWIGRHLYWLGSHGKDRLGVAGIGLAWQERPAEAASGWGWNV